jgi:hypothetical protein
MLSELWCGLPYGRAMGIYRRSEADTFGQWIDGMDKFRCSKREEELHISMVLRPAARGSLLTG